MLTAMMKPRMLLETGVGQGYMTRFLTDRLSEGQSLVAFESDDRWREELWNLPFWNDNQFTATLSPDPTPSITQLVEADLCVFDSDWDVRFTEVHDWHHWAKPGAVCLIHDTGDQPETIHASLRSLITDLGMTGVFLKNPRGCFMAVQGKEE
jgi:hypothetical protein